MRYLLKVWVSKETMEILYKVRDSLTESGATTTDFGKIVDRSVAQYFFELMKSPMKQRALTRAVDEKRALELMESIGEDGEDVDDA